MSVLHGNGNGMDFCGPRSYSMSTQKVSASANLNSTELAINITTGLITLYTTNNLTVGTHTATLTVGLSDYPTIPK